MTRVELLDASTAPIAVQPYFAAGDPGPIVAALAQVPELVGPTLGFVGAALGAGAASTRLKELAILRTSSLQGCRYCIHAHTSVALDVGLTLDEVRALRGEIPLEVAFEGAEQVLVRWIDAMGGTTGPIADGVWDAARAAWPEHVLVELSITIGATMFLNRFATGFELPSSDDVVARVASVGLS
jgi:AhpD family alkylhydroperoxidase